MHPLHLRHIRIARPSGDLEAAEQFWVNGLGMSVLYKAGPAAEGGHALLMLGWPEAAWHLELVGDIKAHSVLKPSEEDLLVIYTGISIDEDFVERLKNAGGKSVVAQNP